MRSSHFLLLSAALAVSLPALAGEPDLAAYPEDAVPLSMRKGPAGDGFTAEDLEELKEGEVLHALIDNEDNPVKKGVALAVIDAEPAKVFATIGDYENFKDFMPYVAKTKVDERAGNETTVSYWLEFPLGLSGRNYQLKLTDGIRMVEGVKVYVSEWFYTGKGNIKDTTGSWEITPWGKGKSLARYTVFTDPGGRFPTWIKNRAAATALPKVLEAVRDRVKSKDAKAAPAEDPALLGAPKTDESGSSPKATDAKEPPAEQAKAAE